jgi:hypothetical protein
VLPIHPAVVAAWLAMLALAAQSPPEAIDIRCD